MAAAKTPPRTHGAERLSAAVGELRAQGTRITDARVAILDTGAYGSVMSSAYNARPAAAEVMVDGAAWSVIRDRQTHTDLWRAEHVPDWLQ